MTTITISQPSKPVSASRLELPLIEVSNLSKWFGDHQVLKDVSFSVDRSEVVCVIGPSGSGKSTLLRCLNLLEEYQQGTVTIRQLAGGGDLRHAAGERAQSRQTNAIRRQVAMVFQQFNLWPHMTAVQNVARPLELVHGYSAEQARSRAMEMLEKVGLQGKADQHPIRLSGGQQQRVGIARAL